MQKHNSHSRLTYIVLIVASLVLSYLTLSHGQVKSAITSRTQFSVLAVGDVMLARSVNSNIVGRRDPTWPFVNVAKELAQADLTIGNLETPLVNNCPITTEGMVFCGDAGNADGLRFAGFDYLSLANNHSGNYGSGGIQETVDALSSRSLHSFGISEAEYVSVRGIKLALIGLDDVTRRLDEERLKTQITNAAHNADVVIVFFHWGAEYEPKSNARQQALAHLAIDSGASLVIGAHPHVVQEREVYKDKFIYYSLGNFIFDQEWSQATKEGLAVKFTFQGNSLLNIQEMPVIIRNYGQANWHN